MTIAVDLDGCLAQTVEPFDPLLIGDPAPGALGVLRGWMDAGHHRGKPHADLYLDDRAVTVTADAEMWAHARYVVDEVARREAENEVRGDAG